MTETQETTTRTCTCGCGQATSSSKTAYRPGHDARHAGNVARHVATTGDDTKLAELPSDALRTKARNMAQRMYDKAQAQAAKLTAKNNTNREWTDADPVTVGRWTYPARTDGKTTQRNSKRDGSGSWIDI